MKLACCGLECDKCQAYIAYNANDRELAEKLAQEWSKTYGQNISADDVLCHGCHSDKRPGVCASCQVRSCCYNEGIGDCTDCADYPCEKIAKLQSILLTAKEHLYHDGEDD